MTLPIEKVIVLSTSHITKEVAEVLSAFVTNDAGLSFVLALNKAQ